MSRRQSRVSIDARQNDTLLEFENFKKKFLLANKHITKLNSTLSVRIEELNAQISTLYVENLRLRASEIALTSQLKRERERSRKIIADTEAATHSLLKHLGHIRKSFSIPHSRSSSEESQPPAPTAVRAKRPVVNPNASPAPNRLARPPTFPGITEDDETNLSSPGEPDADVEEELEASPTPVKRRKTKPHTSDSRLPVPTRVASPPPVPEIDFSEQLNKVGKRKPTRRQSGLLSSVSITTVTSGGISTEIMPPRPPSPAFGSPFRREVGLAEEEEELAAVNGEVVGPQYEEQEVEVILQAVTKRERREKKLKEKDRDRDRDKDRDRDIIADSGTSRDHERKRSRVHEEPAGIESSGGSKSKLKDVTNSQAAPSVLSLFDAPDRERQRTSNDDEEPTATTSTHTLSSSVATRNFLSAAVDPPPITHSSRTSYLASPRTSSPPPAAASEAEPVGGRERRVRKSINYAEPKLNTKMRKPDAGPSTSKRASTSSGEGSALRASPEAPAQDPPPAPDPGAVRRKKSRARMLSEDGEESEGAQADAEFGGLRAAGSGWVNMEGRRRSVQSGSGSLRRVEGDDARRHSLAV
ncbi:hypothetical protein SCP_0412580 [Sparassis crispa]|uniref:Shugoshin C-terminal domain-containing protein n=1 Tax=Sparassis crispa TaxID=139825 RepID=A0A401GL22_9APHY|nr:hypothetical protein SCP_0412580 [Sparassis crispa]GBE82871.1 hypothetical protein SCP_0412580 [Sparassis crispa]